MGLNLPPGFRFYPTDEELVVHFLHRKAALLPCHPDVIPDLHLYPYDPWDLHGKAMCEGRKWYYYSRRSPNSNSRITESGYWQPIGVEEAIYSSSSGGVHVVGSKKYSAFYIGEPSSQGVRTNWVMHEYTTSSNSSSRKKNSKTADHSKWVLCRVYEEEDEEDEDGGGAELSCLDQVFLSLDDDLDDEITFPN